MILSHVPQLLFPSSWILDFETVIIYFSAGFSFFFNLFVSNTSCNIVFNFLLLHSHYVCLRKKEGWTNRRDGGGGIGVCIVLLGIYITFKQVMDPSYFYVVIWIRILQEKHELTLFKTFTIYPICLSPCLTFAESKVISYFFFFFSFICDCQPSYWFRWIEAKTNLIWLSTVYFSSIPLWLFLL